MELVSIPSRRLIVLAACLNALAARAQAQWTIDSLSLGRYKHAATAVDGVALFAGGGDYGTGFEVDVVDLYDASSSTWTTATLSQARTDFAAASANGKAVFGGGFAGGWKDTVDMYDAATGSWSTAALVRPRSNLAAVSVGRHVVFAGGRVAGNHSASQVDIYNTTTNNWTDTRLSLGRHDLAATSVGNLALFAGGTLSTTSTPARAEIDIWNSTLNIWSTHQLSLARTELAATSVAGKALFAGGRSMGNVYDRVDVYDSTSGTWSTAALSQARFGLTAMTVGHLAVFAGGATDQLFTPTDVVDIYDSSNGSWKATTLSEARVYPLAVGLGDIGLVGGGFNGSNGSDRVDVFDPRVGASFCSPAVPNSTGLSARIRGFGSAVTFNNDVTLIVEHLPPGEFGYFLVGTGTTPFNPPGSNGILCLFCSGCGIGRYNHPGEIIQGPGGSLALDLMVLPITPNASVQPGETWNFQCWFRDSSSSNFTDAITILFQ